MAELPSGTVTFLFMDFERSTRRWEHEPDAMRVALTRHDALLERAAQKWGGIHIRTRGERISRLAVVGSAPSGIAATPAIQPSVAARSRPTPGPAKVRSWLHVGAAELRYGGDRGLPGRGRSQLRGIGPESLPLERAPGVTSPSGWVPLPPTRGARRSGR